MDILSVAKVMSSKLLVASHLSSCVRLCLCSCLGGERATQTWLSSTRQHFALLFQNQNTAATNSRRKAAIFHRGHSQGKNSKSATRVETESAKFKGLKNRTKLALNPGFFAVLNREIDWVFFDQNQRWNHVSTACQGRRAFKWLKKAPKIAEIRPNCQKWAQKWRIRSFGQRTKTLLWLKLFTAVRTFAGPNSSKRP